MKAAIRVLGAVLVTLFASAVLGLAVTMTLSTGYDTFVLRLFETSPAVPGGSCFGSICVGSQAPH